MGEICLGVVVKNLGVALVLLLDSAIDFFSGLLNFLVKRPSIGQGLRQCFLGKM